MAADGMAEVARNGAVIMMGRMIAKQHNLEGDGPASVMAVCCVITPRPLQYARTTSQHLAPKFPFHTLYSLCSVMQMH